MYEIIEEEYQQFLQDMKDNNPIVFEGYVTESNVCYKRKTYMRPVKHNYSDDEHPNYYKYSCPVCDILGNRHQVTVGDTNCPLCNVNLLWEGYFD